MFKSFLIETNNYLESIDNLESIKDTKFYKNNIFIKLIYCFLTLLLLISNYLLNFVVLE